MMTIIEARTMEAIQSINRKMKDRSHIDWEQRRYEIAKDAMAAIISRAQFGFTEDVAADAVCFANALVKELKNNPL